MSSTKSNTLLKVPDPMEESSSFSISAIPEHLNRKHPEEHSGVFYMLYVRQGGGQMLTSGGLMSIEDNKVYCLSSGQLVMLSPSQTACGYLLTFTAGFLKISKNQVNPLHGNNLFNCTCIDTKDEELERLLSQVMDEYNGDAPLKYEILREYVKVLLIYLRRLELGKSQVTQYTSNATIINRFFELLRQHYATKKKVSDYAVLMSISPNHLNYTVKRCSGHPVSYHIQQYVINEARRQALHTKKSMKEIAFDLGFDENAHFSKFFKKVHGCTFSRFRKLSPERML